MDHAGKPRGIGAGRKRAEIAEALAELPIAAALMAGEVHKLVQ
jgi:hypothetical protein